MSFKLNTIDSSGWDRFKKYYLPIDSLGFALDISRLQFADDYLQFMEPKINEAFEAMQSLEAGNIANPDENRQVGHYWLRNPDIAPSQEIKQAIISNIERIKTFSKKIHSAQIVGQSGPFKNLLIIGIGGSALGPQFVSQALGNPKFNKLTPFFLDNTDPDGIDLTFQSLEGQLGQTLVIVISKSGSTPETKNGMIETQAAYKHVGLDFNKHAVAITGAGSDLYNYSKDSEWLEAFPLWDWVGGRTSELASVGLLPAALQGIDIDELLRGAKAMDVSTRSSSLQSNPAALLALSWFYATNGKGEKDMVILPYKDRLSLFSKYLQQLIMESLGKEFDLNGNKVNQGIAVYGNKGSTDQHAYIQQLREGLNNFFVTFIEVKKDRSIADGVEVSPGNTSGDYLQAFLLGTRDALSENNRESITITIDEVSPYSIGLLIALYERAVGFYASLINVNAYHQPGVEAGKKAASSILSLKEQIINFLNKNENKFFNAEEITNHINTPDKTELAFKILEHLAANPASLVSKIKGEPFYESKFTISK